MFTPHISAVVVFVVLARMPGDIARKRNHPQAEAVAIGGWLGLLFGGVLWPLVMIWAFFKHPGQKLSEGDQSPANSAKGNSQS